MKITISNIEWDRNGQASVLGFMNNLFDALRTYKKDTGDRVSVSLGENVSIHGMSVDLSEFDVVGDEGASALAKVIVEHQNRTKQKTVAAVLLALSLGLVVGVLLR